MKITTSVLATWLLLMVLPLPTRASDIVPFRTYNQNPVTQIFGLPAIGESAVLKKGMKEAGLFLDLANNHADSSSGGERIVIDGETYLLNITGRFGVSNRVEIGFEVPYIFQSGGFLDSFIEDYHSAFGFSDGGRGQTPNGRLLFRYQRSGSNVFLVDKCGSGIGDIRLTAGIQLYENYQADPRAIALRISLKLPTGDSHQLRGSGGADLALWLVGSRGYKTEGTGMWEVFGGAGLLGMSNGDLMPEQQRHAVLFGSLGAGWKPLSWLALKVQLDGQTSFYKDSGLDEINSPSAQAVVGGSLFFSDKSSLEIGLSEDLIIKTAPDVVFHFALNYRF